MSGVDGSVVAQWILLVVLCVVVVALAAVARSPSLVPGGSRDRYRGAGAR